MKKYNNITIMDTWQGEQHLVRLTEDKDIFIHFNEETFAGIVYLGQLLNIKKSDGHIRGIYPVHESLPNIRDVENDLIEMSRDMWKRKVELWEGK